MTTTAKCTECRVRPATLLRRTVCAACYQRNRKAIMRKQYIADGLCPNCGKRRGTLSKALCDNCATLTAQSTQTRLARGYCAKCGNMREAERRDNNTCIACAAVQRTRDQRRRPRKTKPNEGVVKYHRVAKKKPARTRAKQTTPTKI